MDGAAQPDLLDRHGGARRRTAMIDSHHPRRDGATLHRSIRNVLLCLIWLIASISSAAEPAHAESHPATVQVPITVDYLTLAEALKSQLYTHDGRADLWKGTDQCQYLYAERPKLARAGAYLDLQTDATLSLGLAVAGRCISPITWSGIIDAEMEPYAADRTIKLRMVDINLLNHQHQKTLIAGRGFDLIKQYFIPRMETFTFDLNAPIRQLQQLALAASAPQAAGAVRVAFQSVRLVPPVAPVDQGLRTTVEFRLPAMPTVAPPAPATPLTPKELAAFEKLLDQWDAFVVFSIKQLAGVNNDPRLRQQLLNLLLDGRYRLVQALQDPQMGGADPVRLLFLEEWNELGKIVRAAAQRGELGNRALEFLSFISAGDALFAMDQAAPALGMQISADDLRRLAHLIAPRLRGDPLAFSFKEDRKLQKTLGIGFPPEAGQIPLVTPSPAASPSPIGGPVSHSAPTPILPGPTPAASPAAKPSSMRAPSLWWLLEPPAVVAAEMAPSRLAGDPALRHLGEKLKLAVVTDRNVDRYRGEISRLLDLTSQLEISRSALAPRYRFTYRRLVKAVAWQESCWRQFVRDGDRIVYLESATHDIGLMQINKYVWRGFYSIPALEWNVSYNAAAGAQILARFLQGVADKPGASGGGNQLARSVYAAYNGGPAAYRRWRGHETRFERLIDDSFRQKFRAVVEGKQVDILSCSAQWGKVGKRL